MLHPPEKQETIEIQEAKRIDDVTVSLCTFLENFSFKTFCLRYFNYQLHSRPPVNSYIQQVYCLNLISNFNNETYTTLVCKIRIVDENTDVSCNANTNLCNIFKTLLDYLISTKYNNFILFNFHRL